MAPFLILDSNEDLEKYVREELARIGFVEVNLETLLYLYKQNPDGLPEAFYLAMATYEVVHRRRNRARKEADSASLPMTNWGRTPELCPNSFLD